MKWLALILAATPAVADAPVVEAVSVAHSGDAWRFDVTLSHPDSGWNHYADGWRLEMPDGTVLGTRVLVHPHEAEQPFTRSLFGVVIPAGVIRVNVRARCLVDGWNTEATGVSLSD